MRMTGDRFTPTRVGRLSVRTAPPSAHAVHSYTRGEISQAFRGTLRVYGSPPHAWGDYGVCTAKHTLGRFTPHTRGEILTNEEFEGNCHCNEKSGRLFNQATPGVGTGGGRIAGGAAPQAVLERHQQGTSVPAQAAQQGQHGLQGLRQLVQRQAGLFFLRARRPRSRKKCRSMHRVMWRCQPCQLRPS